MEGRPTKDLRSTDGDPVHAREQDCPGPEDCLGTAGAVELPQFRGDHTAVLNVDKPRSGRREYLSALSTARGRAGHDNASRSSASSAVIEPSSHTTTIWSGDIFRVVPSASNASSGFSLMPRIVPAARCRRLRTRSPNSGGLGFSWRFMSRLSSLLPSVYLARGRIASRSSPPHTDAPG